TPSSTTCGPRIEASTDIARRHAGYSRVETSWRVLRRVGRIRKRPLVTERGCPCFPLRGDTSKWYSEWYSRALSTTRIPRGPPSRVRLQRSGLDIEGARAPDRHLQW